MDAVLAFFSDLILFSAGIVVCVLWIALFCAIVIEFSDNTRERKQKEKE